MQHNLRVGAKYGRTADVGDVDFASLAASALLCQGVLPDSPQTELALRLLDLKKPEQVHRYATRHDFPFSRSADLFVYAQPDNTSVEANLQRHRRDSRGIRELLEKQPWSTVCSRVRNGSYALSLNMLVADGEDTKVFSFHEFDLLKQLRREQRSTNKPWKKCSLVCTILYNVVAQANQNSRFSLGQRGHAIIQKRLAAIDRELDRIDSTQSEASRLHTIFTFVEKPVIDSTESPAECHLQADLFDIIRAIQHHDRKKTLLFEWLYDFAASISPNISPKSHEFMVRKWKSLIKQNSRLFKVKIGDLRAAVGTNGNVMAKENTPAAETDPPMENAQYLAVDMAALRSPDFPAEEEQSLDCHVDPRQPLNGVALNSHEMASEQPRPAASSSRREFINEADRDWLCETAVSMGSSSCSKWTTLLEQYRIRQPTTGLNVESLRSRVRRFLTKPSKGNRKRPYPFESHQLPTHQVPTVVCVATKTACDSCKKKKRGCGPTSSNSECQQVIDLRKAKASTQSILSFCV